MQEKQEKTIIIKHLESDVVERLLKFTYTDKLSNITPVAPKLLPKADEYDIAKLKTLSEQSIIDPGQAYLSDVILLGCRDSAFLD